MPSPCTAKAERAHVHELDLFRALACLMVVAFHYLARGQIAGWIHDSPPQTVAQTAQYGYLGVHLFFMISGFVIFMSAEGVALRSFLASRVARLYPALWVAAPLTALTAWALQDAAYQVSWTMLWLNLTLLPHWFGAAWVDGSYWSLAVEVQFYLLIALALKTSALAHIEKLLIAWLALAAFDLLRPTYPLEFWLVVDRAAFFSAGILAYVIRQRGFNLLRMSLFGVSWLLALLEAARECGKIRLQEGLPLSATVVELVVSAFFVLLALIATGRSMLPRWRWMTWAGALTYPVYLVHQNIGYMLLNQAHLLGLSFAVALALTFALVVSASWCIHQFVEKPWGPRLRNRMGPPRIPDVTQSLRSNASGR